MSFDDVDEDAILRNLRAAIDGGKTADILCLYGLINVDEGTDMWNSNTQEHVLTAIEEHTIIKNIVLMKLVALNLLSFSFRWRDEILGLGVHYNRDTSASRVLEFLGAPFIPWLTENKDIPVINLVEQTEKAFIEYYVNAETTVFEFFCSGIYIVRDFATLFFELGDAAIEIANVRIDAASSRNGFYTDEYTPVNVNKIEEVLTELTKIDDVDLMKIEFYCLQENMRCVELCPLEDREDCDLIRRAYWDIKKIFTDLLTKRGFSADEYADRICGF